MLQLDSVTKRFGAVSAVDGVSLDIDFGELRAIIGANGCGKTTLFNLITGYLQPTSGKLVFNGKSLAGLPMNEIARLGIVRKFQVPSLFSSLSVADNLRVSGADDIPAALQQVGLADDAKKPADQLPHGKKQWLELAMVLAAKPRLLLLDEPAAGMTRAERTATVELVKGLRNMRGLAIMLIEHDMDFVEALDCTIYVMDMGKIIATGSYDQVKRDHRVRAAYLGPVHA